MPHTDAMVASWGPRPAAAPQQQQQQQQQQGRRRGAPRALAAAGGASAIGPYPDPFPAVPAGGDLPPGYGDPTQSPPKHRRAGVVLHPTSLPGKYGVGEIGGEALRFVDWMAAAGLTLWQVLPLVPPETTYWSPYSGLDGLCGNTLLLPLDGLVELGLLAAADLPAPRAVTPNADFAAVHEERVPLLEAAAAALLSGAPHGALREGMAAFRRDNAWVEQSALFAALTELPELEGVAWWDWPADLRDREPAALEAVRAAHADRIERFVALQFLFDHFWGKVKAYANARGVRLGGDMPIYVGGQSADVWASRHLFELTATGAPALVSGVPPDAFSETGQLWGSPLYDWQAHAAEGYAWWVQRFRRSLALYDETRVDHFRAFAGYWAVEATQETAMVGVWKKGPGADLFRALEAALGGIPILAEDLGVITPDVIALREAIGAPGMVVLQFAWGGGPANTHLPHNHYENCFAYPGTHDNQTAVGWWKGCATPEERGLVRRYLGMSGDDVAWAFIREASKSVARTAVFTMQDIMRLDDSARMNVPGKAAGNWSWRVGESCVWDQLRAEAADLRQMLVMNDRCPEGGAPGAGAGGSGSVTFH